MDTLETDRLVIRPFTMDDLEEAYQLLDVDMQWAGPNISIEWRKKHLSLYITLSEWEEGGRLYGFRAIVLRASGQIVGLCGFLQWLWTPRGQALFWPLLIGPIGEGWDGLYSSFELSVGYGLSSQHRGKGYATEAVRALLDHAFRELSVRRVFAGTNRSNLGSISLMKRIGMRVADNPEHPDMDWPNGPGVVGMIVNDLL
jgi:ribosomal-protein-alanine N-acetyltransferase